MRNLLCIALVTVALAACGESPAQRAIDAAADARNHEFESRIQAHDAVYRHLSDGDRSRYEGEMLRVSSARQWGLPDTATNERINFVESESDRIVHAQEYNLPRNTPWPEIYDVEFRRSQARSLGLPETATQAQVDQAFGAYEHAEAAREHSEYVASLGLPPTATDEEVDIARTAKYRRELAREIGLPDTATESQIRRRLRERAPSAHEIARMRAENSAHLAAIHAEDLRRAREARNLLHTEARARGLPLTSTRDDIEAWEVNRARREIAVYLHLPETADWGVIYDRTQNPPPPDDYS